MYYIQFDAIHVVKFTMKRDALHVQQTAEHFHRFTHSQQRLFPFNSNVPGQWVPPGANAANYAVRS
jgi:hypothetical protein